MTLEARAPFPSSAFAESETSVGRTSQSVARALPPLRRRPGLKSRTGTVPAGEAETPTSIFFASVEAVRRSLGTSVTLDAVEMACAETYRRPADRERYYAARMLLRHALSKAVGGNIAPAEWRYREGPHGKPMMAEGFPQLEFNVSHSENCVAVGVSLRDPIGVDIECLRPPESLGIIREVLTEGEEIRMRNCPPSQQWTHFVRLWTAKEACTKALGLGLSLDFATIDVHLDPLRVRLLEAPAGVSTEFDIASTTVTKSGVPYCLTTARLIGKRSGT